MPDEAGRGVTISKTLKIVEALLQGQELTVRDVAALLKIEPASARRHLKPFPKQLNGVGLRERSTPYGKAYSLPPRDGDDSPPSLATAIAACLGASLAPLFKNTQFGPAMQEALDRIVRHAKQAAKFKDIDRKFFFHERGGELALPNKGPTFKTIVEAVLEGHLLRIHYTDFGGKAYPKLDVKPLSVMVYQHQLYLIASTTKRPRHAYRFSRIRDVDVLDRRFKYPPVSSYDPSQVFRNSFGIYLDGGLPVVDVRIRLSSRWKNYVEGHRWHPSQSIEKDGKSVVVRLHVALCKELEAWILGLGEHAVVLEPPELRETIAKRVADAAALYATISAKAKKPGPKSRRKT